MIDQQETAAFIAALDELLQQYDVAVVRKGTQLCFESDDGAISVDVETFDREETR